MVPASYLYFDMSQIAGESNDAWLKRVVNLEKVYNFNPPASKYNMGMQACLWTENVQTPSMAEFRTFPRVFGMAEIAWSQPKEKKLPESGAKSRVIVPATR